jgi:hypothetical protein
MDDQDVSPLVGVVALGVILAGLAAVAWLLVDMSHTTGGGHDRMRMSEQQFSAAPYAHPRQPNRIHRCIDAAATRDACVAASTAPSAPATTAGRRAQRSARHHAVAAPSSPTRDPAPTVAASLPSSTPQPSTPQPSTVQPATPPPPDPTRQSPPHDGPVPGGSTSPPHTGPRP